MCPAKGPIRPKGDSGELTHEEGRRDHSSAKLPTIRRLGGTPSTTRRRPWPDCLSRPSMTSRAWVAIAYPLGSHPYPGL